ncbi:MAG: hypothetical protein UH853_02540 [Muribaculaceae bacterium]|jgi:hypothetical protein|nr:hypothetical protein [Muribaculaceae bacterium]
MDSIIITPYVINTIKALPAEHREAIAAALAGELFIGEEYQRKLTPYQEMLFAILSFQVKQDTRKNNKMHAVESNAV